MYVKLYKWRKKEKQFLMNTLLKFFSLYGILHVYVVICARVGLGCWWGKSSQSLLSLVDLRGWSATLELRHGPNAL